ncbi:enoyl-CoA hydratase/isomerase family protein [Alkalihalobacterium alkalinitrilicum]|uniref:enoyl-CoA hydratase/isomerase family protein n=1 Tax=Alkalihalobacterium alkalinitrilicum TaxID=427920 RepID=UPI00099502CA|nr:enoyl-CoA hydratase-related protein [Alkalihalobacterium alkalinitrilicum]
MSDLLFSVNNEGVATIKLNRPDRLNAFSLEMINQWIEALEEVRDSEEIRALVLTGEGRAFCAGGDVKSMVEGDGFLYQKEDEHIDFMSTGMKRKKVLWKYVQRIPLIMSEIDKPVIAAINGPAIGAGLDMALMCDIRFASRTAKMGETYIKAGIVPGDGAAYFLPRIVGIDKALELLWTGKILTAEEAKEYGMVTYIAEPEELLDKVYDFASTLAKQPSATVQFMKRTVYQGLNNDLRTSLDMISSAMGLVTELPEYRERLETILKKD